MKKLTALFFLLFSITSFAQTYQYHPFPKSDANWKWRVFTEFMVPTGWQNEIYTEVSDTMVGSSGSYFEKNKKVYYQFKDSANFELVYDFNITVGDTFYTKGYSNIQNSFDYVVLDDSSGTDPTFPNRRILQFNSGVRWVEGIGNVISSYTMPFSLNHTPTSISGGGTVFKCQYSDGQSFPCQDAFLLHVDENDLALLKLYPNPTSNYLNLKHAAPHSEIEVFDLMGMNLTNQVFNKHEVLDVSRLKPGTYLLKLSSANGATFKRFVKK